MIFKLKKNENFIVNNLINLLLLKMEHCTDIFKYILSYLPVCDIIRITSLSKNTNKIIKENLKFEFTECDIDKANHIIKTYKNSMAKLKIYHEKDDNIKKLNHIEDNIISLETNEILPMINMKNLEYLDIDVINIKKIKIKLEKLKHIHIDKYSNYSRTTFVSSKKSLQNLNNIESLRLSGGIHVSLSLTNFKNLKELNIFCCKEMENKEIENLINLESIYLAHNEKITDDAFKNLNKIKVLVLYKTYVTSNVLKYLPNIESWCPNTNIIIRDNYEYLKNIKKLKILDLSRNEAIYDENIRHINIEHIILSNNNYITINGLDRNIKKIDLENNVMISDENIKKFDLTYLNLKHNYKITNKGLKYCKNLKALNLCHNYLITDQGLSNMTNLEYLSLEMNINDKITNKSLKNLTKLKFLNLKDNGNITSEGIKPLINLEYLSIENNKKIKIDGLLNLKKLREIKCVNSLLSREDLHILVNNNINLKIIYNYSDIKINLPSFYYSKQKYFVDNYDKTIFDFFYDIQW